MIYETPRTRLTRGDTNYRNGLNVKRLNFGALFHNWFKELPLSQLLLDSLSLSTT
jgi:hypothetical protein